MQKRSIIIIMRTIRDEEPRTATSTFTRLLSSVTKPTSPLPLVDVDAGVIDVPDDVGADAGGDGGVAELGDDHDGLAVALGGHDGPGRHSRADGEGLNPVGRGAVHQGFVYAGAQLWHSEEGGGG